MVPGSGLVKEMADAEGIGATLLEAGFDWREPGLILCLSLSVSASVSSSVSLCLSLSVSSSARLLNVQIDCELTVLTVLAVLTAN